MWGGQLTRDVVMLLRNIMNKEIKKSLLELGYNQNWLDYGIIDEEYLLNQYRIFQSSDDKNTEHYRYMAFLDYLKNKTLLTDLEMENCIKLKDEVIDGLSSYENRIHELIRFPFLTDQQFEKIDGLLGIQSNSLSKIYNRISILRQSDKTGVNLKLLDQAISLKDTVLERKLLDYKNIPKNCLELLREKGISRAVRNRATSMLKSNNYKSVT